MIKQLLRSGLALIITMSLLSTVAFAGLEGMQRSKSTKLPGEAATSLSIGKEDREMIIGLGKDGLAWLDIRNPRAPFLKKHLLTSGNVVSTAFDGRNTFAGMADGTIWAVDLKTENFVKIEVESFDSAPVHLALSPKGNQLIAVNGKQAVLLEFKGKVGNNTPIDVIALPLSLEGKGLEAPATPNPIKVTFSPNGKTAAIALQLNNGIAIVDMESKKVERIFSTGVTKHRADLKDDGVPFIEDSFTGRLEAGDLTFSPDGKFIYTANEGSPLVAPEKEGIWSGGRNFSIFQVDGTLAYDGMDKLEQSSYVLGSYPDSRSLIRGIEPNGVAIGKIDDKPAMAISARQANAIFFFQLEQFENPFFVGMVASGGKKPVAISGFQTRDGFAAVDEDGLLSIYLPILNNRETGTGH